MKLLIASCVVVFLMSGCGGIDVPSLDSLVVKQPRILAVKPDDGTSVGPDTDVSLEFSEGIDPATINSSTLAIVKLDNPQVDPRLVESVVKGDLVGVDGAYNFSNEGRSVTFRASESYEPGTTYQVIATERIMSDENIPLAPMPGKAGSAFVSLFLIEGSVSDAETGPSDGSFSGVDPATSIARPTSLVINELLYDVSGDDTNGQVFIELFGDPASDVSGYKVVFVTGDTGVETDVMEIPQGTIVPGDGIFVIADAMTGQSGISQVASADIIKNFDPQNGPDCVQLFNEKGSLIDALGYGSPIIPLSTNGRACFEGTPASKVTAGQSLSRVEGMDTADNAVDFHAVLLPTPGVL